jgi:hypothetical protein
MAFETILLRKTGAETGFRIMYVDIDENTSSCTSCINLEVDQDWSGTLCQFLGWAVLH